MAGTLHSQVTDDLRKAIVTGDLKPGDALPSEAQIQEQYDVSRATARRALLTLEQQGLVTAWAGRGRRVRDLRPMIYRPQDEFRPRRSDAMDRFETAQAEDGRKTSQSIDISVKGADPFIAERFGVPEGTPVVARMRVRSIDGEPFNINDTYYSLDVAQGTAVMSPGNIPEGSNAVIRAILGPEVRAVDEFFVRMPTPEEAERLKLGTGTPVAVEYSTGYTADDKVIRVEYFVLPGDRHVIVYEREHPSQATE